MSWTDLSEPGVRTMRVDSERARFGVDMVRVVVGLGTSEDRAAADVMAVLSSLGRPEVVVARWPSEMVGLPAVLADHGGVVVPADTLVYWAAEAAALARVAVDPSVQEGRPSLDDVTVVTRESFARYPNHYAANPLLDRDLATAGYVEWAQRSFTADPASVLAISVDGRVVGVATTTAPHSGADHEILLAGLLPGAQGHGWYQGLLAAVGQRALADGAQRVVISTQASNVRVQRAWVRGGFAPVAAFTTAHVVDRTLWTERRPHPGSR